MFEIRRATPADGVRVLDVWRRAVDETHDFLSPQDRHEIEQEVITFLPEAPLWLAVDHDDQALGFMLMEGSHLEALFIDPSYRGIGIGRALVEHALANHTELTSDVNEQNEQAVGFYKHLGFEHIGRSSLDGQGRPYPLIHLRYCKSPS